MTDRVMELFAALGSPARLLGRLPFISRYAWGGMENIMPTNAYAETRYGKSYRARPWLLFDVRELEITEQLINHGSDKRVRDFRKHQLEALQIVGVVGALVVGAAVTTLQLPGLTDTSYVSRGLLTVSLVDSLLATFFTVMQQRTYGFIEEPSAIRAWLSNGVQYIDALGNDSLQSSSVSHQLLQAPFELLSISITCFLGGIGVYLGSCVTQHLDLGSEEEGIGNRGVLITFAVAAFFSLSLLGQLLGGKDAENARFRRGDVKGNRSSGMYPGVGKEEDGGPRMSLRAASPLGLKIPAFDPLGAEGRSLSPGGVSVGSRMSFGGEGREAIVKALEKAAAAHRAVAVAEEEVARLLEGMR